MAGDEPMDDEAIIECAALLKAGVVPDSSEWEELYFGLRGWTKAKPALAVILEDPREVKDLLETLTRKFVLPWRVYLLEITFRSEETRALLRGAIEDGGHAERGYGKDEYGPGMMSDALREIWDDVTSGRTLYKDAPKLMWPGLLKVIEERASKAQKGLVNVR
jgi:hypothetical protein